MFIQENFLPSAFVSVIVPVPVSPTGALIYHVPEALRPRLVPGMRVLVPVGRRKVTGIVTNSRPSGDLPALEKVKDILDILDEDIVFPEDLMRLWQWAAEYYLTTPGEMLRTILPGSFRRESTRIVSLKKEPPKRQRAAGQTDQQVDTGLQEARSTAPTLGLTSSEQEIMALVKAKSRVTVRALQRRFPALALGKVLEKLEALDMVEVREHLPQKRGTRSATNETMLSEREEHPDLLTLSPAQEQACAQVTMAVHESAFRVFLLHGVAGSGKTEVYLRVAQDVLALGRSVLILVPEIGLTHQLVKQVRQRFGMQVAVLHSGMVISARWQEWQRIARREVKVVVGVRSAVFAPLDGMGLIVVDEEHDTAYKQEEGVRYNARDLAIVRGKIASCPVLLGSATPSLESYAHSRTHHYSLIELPERVASRQLPRVEIVDLRQAAKGERSERIFSPVLRDALIANLQAGKQSLLFLNRRGYSSYLQCQRCGSALSCPRCSVTLTFHLQGNVLRCHYCDFSRHAPDSCPGCRAPALAGGGIGTEQVEEALKKFLPQARVARLDRDSTSRRGALEQVLKAWTAHQLDVLIGTQMVAKGHDVPNVTLVGVLLADLSLNLPDFRAAERTFQLLTQVAGRAGRRQEQGRVIIQTYVPQHYSIRLSASHDFPRFAARELRYRKRFGYPPFTRMINIRIEGKDEEKVQAVAEGLAQRLRADFQDEGQAPTILGPAPAPIERVKARTRWQLLLKAEDRPALHALIKNAQHDLLVAHRLPGIRTLIDVDPCNML
jgi:primosomal protein N' (replication factor Y)